MAYCEDYPCCGHTPEDPCDRQWYDEPGAFDTSRPGNEHALCDHPNGECDVPEPDPEEQAPDGKAAYEEYLDSLESQPEPDERQTWAYLDGDPS